MSSYSMRPAWWKASLKRGPEPIPAKFELDNGEDVRLLSDSAIDCLRQRAWNLNECSDLRKLQAELDRR